MLFTKTYIPTTKEKPTDAEIISHILLLKAGFIRQEIAGVYTYLPLAWRVLSKIKNILKEEIDGIGGCEILAPTLTSKELWELTGRWTDFGDDMFHLLDRKKRDLCLTPTHEEIFTNLAKRDFRSYRDFPKILYQMQTKFRDEKRPRSGVLRVRHFIMKDSYSFDKDEKGLSQSYNLHRQAYKRIFARVGLNYKIVNASSGLMGGAGSEEFMVLSSSGEDRIVYCQKCSNCENLEIAKAKVEKVNFPASELKKVNTPVGGAVEEVSNFLDYPKKRMIKSLIWMIKEKPVFLLLCGDDELSEIKVENQFGEGRPAHAEEIINITGAPAGYVGPIDIDNIEIIADLRLENTKGMATGANQYHYHYTGVDIIRDIKVDKYLDIRQVQQGDKCVKCNGELSFENAIEVGHIFKLGIKYSKALGATFTNEKGEEEPVVMGSYGIGVERIMASVIEQNNDKDGIIWPISIAPYEVLILPLNISNELIWEKTIEISEIFDNEKIEYLLDDRNCRAGNKFKDADLIGIPIRITIGERNLKNNMVEIKRRDTGKVEIVQFDKILKVVRNIRNNLYGMCQI